MATHQRLDVMVCDDHAVFAEALATALDRDERFGSVRWAQTALDALEIVRSAQPDLAIIDLRLPDVAGTELISQLKACDPAPLVLVLSVASDARSILAVFEAGADGFLGKHESFGAVLEAARSVAVGDVPISASAFARLLPRLLPERSTAGLTAREEGVLELLAENCSNDEIADRLGISPNTARNHVSSILSKLGAEHRQRAVATARRQGLIPDQN